MSALGARSVGRGWIGFALVFLVFLAHALWLIGVAEDAFITFHFARNWLEGHGLVWNVGEGPVEGYTNFLWLVLMACVLGLGLDPIVCSQLLGVACALVALVYTFRCATDLLGLGPLLGLVPCAFLAISGPFAAWATSGMETGLFTLLLVASVYHLAAYWQGVGGGVGEGDAEAGQQLVFAYAALLLAMLTRPEGVGVAGLLLGASVLASRGRAASSLRAHLAPGLACLVFYGVYFGWRWQLFGHPLPNTFYAKTGASPAQVLRGSQYVAYFALHFVTPWLPLLLLAASLLGARERAGSMVRPGWPELLRRHFGLAACALVSLVYTLYIALVGGDYMAMYRFFVPVLPFVYLLLAASVAWVATARGAAGGRVGPLLAAAVSLAVLGTAVHSTPLEKRLFERPWMTHGNYRGVEKERWHVARLSLIGEFFARYARPGESLATAAIGAVAWHSDLRIYDLHGVVDPYIAHHGRVDAPVGSGQPGHEKFDYVYVFEKRPTFYMFNRRLFPQPFPGIPKLVDEVDALVAQDYRVGSVRLVDEVNGESGYFAFLERRDRVEGRERVEGRDRPGQR
ncbi:MAG: hypothetical protein JRG96_10275 [Deltaproteobacteria bacterium]|nr:hypothetical protein [Deltaproteobacteria bacterium]MBW2416912.1 hypothetical protein [Deltaproteobacteria bacterium]